MSKRYERLEEAMCKELEKLDRKYGADAAEMTPQDAERADMLYHALKSAATYHAMKDAEEMESQDDARGGRSYARRRDAMGRYSRDMDPGYSGHYPEMWYPQYAGYEHGNWR